MSEAAPRLAAGQADELFPGFVRVVAPNPSFMTGPGTNSYLLGGPTAVAVVDAGPDHPGHRARLLAEAPGPVRYVLVTHHHPDHAPGAAALAALEGATLLAYGKQGLVEPDAELRDGDRVVVPGWCLEAVETPGHASDHLCFLATPEPGPGRAPARPAAGEHAPPGTSGPPAATGPVLLSGDHVLSGTTVVVPPPDGDMAAYLASLRRLMALEPPPVAIAPGHGSLIEDPRRVLSYYLEHRLEREQQVLAALRRLGAASPGELVDQIYTRRPGPLHAAAERSVWAHLRKLAGDGAATSAAPDDPAARWRPLGR